MNFLDWAYQPTEEERAVSAKTGVTLPELMTRDWFDMGTIPECEYHGAIKVEVMALPARFFRFTVTSIETSVTYRVETGSGRLGDYLPFARALSVGMLTVEVSA